MPDRPDRPDRPAVRTYRDGEPFPGRIGSTFEDSVPSWPVGPRAPKGGPNVLLVVLDDVGFAQLGCFGSDIATPTFDALAAVSKLLATAVTERWRGDKLVTLIERSDAPFQVVVGSLVAIVETAFVADLANEREALNKYYTELQLRSRDPAGLGALGEWREMREGQIRDRESAIGNYVVVLKTIGSGHHKLYESRHELSRVEVQAQVHQYTTRLREAVNAIRSFH